MIEISYWINLIRKASLIDNIRNINRRLDTEIDFMKEEIDIQIESLKIELENLRDVLFAELHNRKKDFIEYE